MDQDLATIVAQRFIARGDAKALQGPDGGYEPVREGGRDVPFSLADIAAHLAGERTYGHYLLDAQSRCKIICFDLDFAKEGTWVARPGPEQVAALDAMPIEQADRAYAAATVVHPATPRADWLVRTHPGRAWYKHQLRFAAEIFTSRIRDLLGIGCAAAYTGSKGVHAYGFFGSPVPAAEAREAASIVIDSIPELVPERGHWRDGSGDPASALANLTVEVYPKQDAVKAGGYGNLLRLVMGVNRKNPADPTFLISQYDKPDTLEPHADPLFLLQTLDPWQEPTR